MVRDHGVRAVGAVHVRECSTKQRGRARLRKSRFRGRENVEVGGSVGTRVPLGDLQSVKPRQLRSPEPALRKSELRPDFQCEEPARDAVRSTPEFLADTGSRWRIVGSIRRVDSCRGIVNRRPGYDARFTLEEVRTIALILGKSPEH